MIKIIGISNIPILLIKRIFKNNQIKSKKFNIVSKIQFDPESVFVCTNPGCKYTKIITLTKEFKYHFKCTPEPCSLKDLKEQIL